MNQQNQLIDFPRSEVTILHTNALPFSSLTLDKFSEQLRCHFYPKLKVLLGGKLYFSNEAR
jgi:hypothetical protein